MGKIRDGMTSFNPDYELYGRVNLGYHLAVILFGGFVTDVLEMVVWFPSLQKMSNFCRQLVCFDHGKTMELGCAGEKWGEVG